MLVDYGSDSETEEVTVPQPDSAKKVTGLQLPPPKSNKKRQVAKITLDVPTPQETALTDDRPAKRPKIDLGAGKKSGLSALLPAPKKSTTKVIPTPAASVGEIQAESVPLEDAPAPLMIPAKVKTHSKQTEATSVDLFGIGSSKAIPLPSIPSTSTSNKPQISSAPSLVERERPNYYATLPDATPDNPYPGFHCLPNGQWQADQPEEWAKWAALNGYTQSVDQPTALDEAVPKGFEGSKFDTMQQAQGLSGKEFKPDISKIPPKVVEQPISQEEEDARQDELRQIRGKARGKNQLSSLLADSVLRRQELEDRIAVARANRKSGGQKYGF